ncbi:MAG TPA: hypothetical protein VFW07_04330 [Parafilimonas sp.]|nr:hypothetical protein [Parafilimonas sp.]
MQVLFVVCAVTGLLLAACTKTEMKPETSIVSAGTAANISIIKKRSNLLVSHSWIYQGFYFHYVDKRHKGDPQYVRGASNNVINLDDTKYIFSKNGTFVEYDGGYTYPGTWKFFDTAASLLILNYQYRNDNDSIQVLNNSHCNYTASMGYHSKSYTELIPAL